MTADPYRREGVGGEDLPPGAYWQGGSIHVGGFILYGSKPNRPPTEEDAWKQWERASGVSRSEYTCLAKDASEAERLRTENTELRRERDQARREERQARKEVAAMEAECERIRSEEAWALRATLANMAVCRILDALKKARGE